MAFTTPLNMTFTALLILISVLALSHSTAASPGTSTHYWDCCMVSPVTSSVRVCGVNDRWLNEATPQNSCVHAPNQHFNTPADEITWGDAFTCRDTAPWAVSDQLAYGFAAVKIGWKTQWDTCCSCYHLTFTSSAIAGKQMIVQATNAGNDLIDNQFDIMIPGGGVGIFGNHACERQWGTIDMGDQYGGFKSRDMCDQLPLSWRDGCRFRFDWYQNVGNPTVDWYEVACPAELTALTECERT
ncbi:hypothetical protein EG328_002890 [Venturia inaequalis]|uniref:cellulase n=1 Tax=Venturia inaequalis TaxID=5025 RepID=A0A8H3UWC5_VENIN|nr:hypothetical protein EG328_002890 [Venturia inaequalis]